MTPIVLGLGSNKVLQFTQSHAAATSVTKIAPPNNVTSAASTETVAFSENADCKTLDCVSIIYNAFAALKKILSLPVMSPIYKTKAMYVTDQPDFFNACVFGYYYGTPEQLLKQIQQIETQFGRNRTLETENGPRSLDIDIELFGNQTISTPNLQIPHPKLSERQFVLIPMLDVLPESADIPHREVFFEYLKKLPNQGVEKYERRNNR